MTPEEFQVRELERKCASLELTATSLQSLISEYSMRAVQAEEAAAALLADADVIQLSAMFAAHSHQNLNHKAIQQQSLLQMTLILLNAALQDDDQNLRTLVNKCCKDLTTALSYMNRVPNQERK